MARMAHVGVVRAVYRYPVKSMRGEALSESTVEWQGIPGDRCYAFVQRDNRTTFPYLTAREVPELLLYTPIISDPSKPYYSPVLVRTPDGAEYPIDSEELHASVAQRCSQPFYLLRLGRRSTHDIAPLSIMTTQSVNSLGETLGMTLDPRRFRPTIVIETSSAEPYPEDVWVGHSLVIGGDEAGGALVRVSEPDIRCKMVTLDPDTATADPRVLEEVVRSRGGQLGVYGVPQRLDVIRVGQAVSLLQE